MNKYNLQLQNEDMRWVGIDLDLTLAKGVWPEEGIGEPLEGAVKAVNQIANRGYKIIIYTSRQWHDYINIENWLNDHKIPFKQIVCGKPFLKYMVDDRNIEFDGDWKKVLNKIT